MTADQLRRAPLDGLRRDYPGVRLTEVPFRAAVNLRADPTSSSVPSSVPSSVSSSVSELLGGQPPTEPNTETVLGDWSVLWLGPDEWLLLGPDGAAPGLVDRLRASGIPAVDVSANRTTIELTGEHARDLLESGCALDLHPRAFAPGRCAQTMVAKAQVILRQTGEQGYELLVRGSFAGYLATWLDDAAQEYVT
ncbi:sarcosine oxidase subunit gamma [Pseudonocardia eucalypti]|uniref:Sarcosine oxidase subunit gamma n=1 Tax=Pseudonocardia eucalypti TaxID=648755 RepID=A0ABP9R9B6_9PSEU|nr:sarcosine oxidase subunit gamma [Pseudonocardia eucalypti]